MKPGLIEGDPTHGPHFCAQLGVLGRGERHADPITRLGRQANRSSLSSAGSSVVVPPGGVSLASVRATAVDGDDPRRTGEDSDSQDDLQSRAHDPSVTIELIVGIASPTAASRAAHADARSASKR